MENLSVSVVLPAYNEEGCLEDAVAAALDGLEELFPAEGYEIIIAENGSSDATPDIGDELAASHEAVRCLHLPAAGKGSALEEGFNAANGTVLAFFDVDLATDMRHFGELIESVRSREYDVATGSRWMSESDVDRPFKRVAMSKGFNTAMRVIFRSNLRDHLCGFKSFHRDALFDILNDVHDNGWFWDPEVLIEAQYKGYRIKEFPVSWESRDDSKLGLKSVLGIGIQILRKRLELTARRFS